MGSTYLVESIAKNDIVPNSELRFACLCAAMTDATFAVERSALFFEPSVVSVRIFKAIRNIGLSGVKRCGMVEIWAKLNGVDSSTLEEFGAALMSNDVYANAVLYLYYLSPELMEYAKKEYEALEWRVENGICY